MINDEPLELHHLPLLNPFLKTLSYSDELMFAEYSFANDYLFRLWHHYSIIPKDFPLLIGKFKDGKSFLIPTISPKDFLREAKEFIDSHHFCLFPIPEKWLVFFPNDRFSHVSEMDDSDYIFTTEKLKNMPGRDLSSRRNLIHQLEAKYTLLSLPLSYGEIPAAREILKQWQKKTEKEDEAENDFEACLESLSHFSELNLFGRIVYGNEEPIGFTIGEMINSTTAVIHFSKYRSEIKGVTPFLYRDFARHLSPEVEWINLEQDLGKPALRQAKNAYRPDKIMSKWRVCPL